MDKEGNPDTDVCINFFKKYGMAILRTLAMIILVLAALVVVVCIIALIVDDLSEIGAADDEFLAVLIPALYKILGILSTLCG